MPCRIAVRYTLPMRDVADQLRRAVRDDPRPSREIAAAVGVNPVNLRKFAGDSLDLSFATLTSLASVLGYDLVVTLKKSRKKSRESS